MRTFLTADWRHLLMLNYPVEPDLLRPILPPGVELDVWNGTTYVSMVGFLFLRTRVGGWSVPGHINFEEVNLRFYVRRRASDGWRRGVVFVKEIVPRRLIAGIARVCYEEPYVALPMRHNIETENGGLRDGGTVEYQWHHQGAWNSLRARASGAPRLPQEGSEEDFITAHHWGYTARRHGRCAEYHVGHERWRVWRAEEASLRCAVSSLYGDRFIQPLSPPPRSSFVAEGSAVTVSAGAMI